MKEQYDPDQIAFDKASELGKTLSSGGITLSDEKTAFCKKCKR